MWFRMGSWLGMFRLVALNIWLLVASVRVMASAPFVNYNNDPVLAEAFRYDAEMNGGNMDLADRAKAVKCYLAYLEHVPKKDTARRAWVYGRLGALHAVAVNRKRGEQPDRQKAKQYFQKVLELEPDRIGRPTIAARAYLAGTTEDIKAKVAALMDLCAWLQPIDEQACIDRWLPRRPDRAKPTKRELRGLVSLCKGMRSATQSNMVVAAMSHRLSLADRVAALRQIIERFPGTEAARTHRFRRRSRSRPRRPGPLRRPSSSPGRPGPGGSPSPTVLSLSRSRLPRVRRLRSRSRLRRPGSLPAGIFPGGWRPSASPS